jgi:hypothetical protein
LSQPVLAPCLRRALQEPVVQGEWVKFGSVSRVAAAVHVVVDAVTRQDQIVPAGSNKAVVT